VLGAHGDTELQFEGDRRFQSFRITAALKNPPTTNERRKFLRLVTEMGLK